MMPRVPGDEHGTLRMTVAAPTSSSTVVPFAASPTSSPPINAARRQLLSTAAA